MKNIKIVIVLLFCLLYSTGAIWSYIERTSDKKTQPATLAEAEDNVLRDPSDWRALENLGKLLWKDGSRRKALKAFQLAADANPRASYSQIVLGDHAEKQENYNDAMYHYEFVLQQRPEPRSITKILESIEKTVAGRRALREAIRNKPNWANSFFRPEDDYVLARRAKYLGEEKENDWGCQTITPIVHALMQREWRAEAEAVFYNQCQRSLTKSPIVDMNFTRVGGEDDPIVGWRRIPTGDVLISQREKGFVFSNRAPAPRPILTQPINLNAGRYTINFSDEELFAATVSCGSLTAKAPQPFRANPVTVPARACRDLALIVWLDANAVDAKLNNISISKTE
ncbi:tetratricopeptide repeat protein [Qipengyuania atrilutea]|uniref:Tetratricopeptide repeat protein n=1 Tax=Qipengyuania atrilutea TaxID=2744473 RepID=A0A850H610_9SPHN|nr:hypothetical protein [Actirhodobacter atriluteus]NVD45927.1 hypothetical protein [Actirhodobacter atriluteus]